MEDFNAMTTTAPMVGRHHKNSQSLVGFDPLLKEGSPGTTSATGHLTSCTESRDASAARVNQDELRSQLRAIASELSQQSSSRGFLGRHQPTKEEKQGGEPSSTPPRPSSRSAPATPSPNRGLRWVRPGSTKKSQVPTYPRTRSMPAVLGGFGGGGQKTPVRSKNTNNTPTNSTQSMNSSRASLSSDMLQELWDIQEQNQGKMSVAPPVSSGDLSIPSLAKPRPTSFLTGREVVLSSEADATEWQLEIPVKSEFVYTSRACCFLETYHSEKGPLLDLASLVGCTSGDLVMFVGGKPSPTTLKFADMHRPVVETLLECGPDLLQVQGYIRSDLVNGEAGAFREVFIVERQRQFLCVFRGTAAEQHGKVEKQPDVIKLSDNKNVSVFADRYKAFQELEQQLFNKLDQLMEDNPFLDFVFTGHGFAAAMATLAAYRYAWARPELRVAAMVTGNVKVGLADFRLSANSLPNLKLVRVELGNARPVATTGVHVGHTIRINPAKSGSQVKAFKFADHCKSDPSPMRKFRINKEKGISEYVDAVDDLGEQWVKDFFRQDGAGVKGKDNETRLVV